MGKQIDEINGTGGKDKFLPHLLGHGRKWHCEGDWSWS